MASGFGEKRCPPSAIPGIGTGRIRGEAILAAGTRALRRTVDSESPRATDTPPGTPGRPPPRRTAAGILGDWSGTLGAAQLYTTHRGLLNQADKHEFPRTNAVDSMGGGGACISYDAEREAVMSIAIPRSIPVLSHTACVGSRARYLDRIVPKIENRRHDGKGLNFFTQASE